MAAWIFAVISGRYDLPKYNGELGCSSFTSAGPVANRIEDLPATHQATPIASATCTDTITLCAKSAGLRKSPGLRDSSSCRRSFSKGIFLGSGSKSPSDRFAFVSSRKSKQYFFSSRALRYSSSVIDLRIVRGRRNIAIPPSKDSDVKIANRNVVKASFDSALVFSNVVFHRDHSVCKRTNAQQPLP